MLRMQKMQWVLSCFLFVMLAHAQSPKEMVRTLEASLADQQLVLKNFSGQDTVQATWSGTGLILEPPQWREFGILTVNGVKLKGHKLTLRCTRRGVVRDAAGRTAFYGQPTKVNIKVDLQDATPKQVLPSIREALFFASVEEAGAAIPKPLQEWVPFRIDAPRPANKAAMTKPCDCAHRDETDCSTRGTKAEVQPPKLVRGADPRYSEDARKAKLNGAVIVQLIADKSGNPQNVWVLRPVGLGLDEAAAKSVLSYSFRPATCRGNPVSVYLNVEVKFQTY